MHWYDMLIAFAGPLLGMLGAAAHHSIVTNKNPMVQALAPLAIQAAEPEILQAATKVSPVLATVAGDVLQGVTGAAPAPTPAPVADQLPPVPEPVLAPVSPAVPVSTAPSNNEGH